MSSPAEPRRYRVTLGCAGGGRTPHEEVAWLGSWVRYDPDSTEPACWVCGSRGYPLPRNPV